MNLVLRWVIILPNNMESGWYSEFRCEGIWGGFFFFCLSLFLITHILKLLDCYIVHYSQLLFMHVSFTVIENCFKKRKKHPVILVFFSKKHWNCFLSCLLIHIFFSSMSQCLLVEKHATNGIVKFLDFCFLILHDLSILVDIHCFAFTYFIYWQRGFEKHTVLLRNVRKRKYI